MVEQAANTVSNSVLMLCQILYQKILADLGMLKYEHRKTDSGFGNLLFLFGNGEFIERSSILIFRCAEILVSGHFRPKIL